MEMWAHIRIALGDAGPKERYVQMKAVHIDTNSNCAVEKKGQRRSSRKMEDSNNNK